MKALCNETYLVNEKKVRLDYFVCGMKDDTGDDSGEYSFFRIGTIAEKAFRAPWNVKRVFFDETLAAIKKEAFLDAGDLEVFGCGRKKAENADELLVTAPKNLPQVASFTIEARAFSGCKSLHTVILPKCKKITIEKDAFSGCEELRTIVLVTEDGADVSFTENPFADCPDHLTFVCTEHSAVDRFARENGYRSVYA